MVPPALKECTLMRSMSIPFLCSSICFTASLTPACICMEVTVCHVPLSSMKSEMMLSSEPPLLKMWCTWCARAVTGPCFSLMTVSWVIVHPFDHFFWFVIFNVHWSAVMRMFRGEDLGSIFHFLKKPVLLTENCTVCVTQTICPLLVTNLGAVYSPTLSR
jgi:hypothetical protein